MAMSRRTIVAGAAGLAAAADAKAQPRRAQRFELDRFVEELRAARPEGQAAVAEVLARAVSEPSQILAALGEPTEVGGHELYRSPDLTVMNVIWSPYMVLFPHDHRMWASIGIYTGREDNILWERDGETAQAMRAASVGEREVFSLPSDAIHSVSNPLRRLTCAIHVYGGDFFGTQRSEWDPETLHERPMDFEAVQQLFREANERFNATQR